MCYGVVCILGIPALLLAPLAFLLAFKYVLGTSFLGAIGLAVVALLGYVAMVHFIGSGGFGVGPWDRDVTSFTFPVYGLLRL
jgi:hypothetical protein